MATTSTKEAIALHQISTTHYSTLSGRSSDLVNNVDELQALNSRNVWHNFSFKEPIYMFEIRLETDGFSPYDGLEVKVLHVDGTKFEKFVELVNGVLTLRSGKLSTGFSFKPPTKVLLQPKLKSVTTYGLTLEEFHSYEWAIKDFEKIKLT